MSSTPIDDPGSTSERPATDRGTVIDASSSRVKLQWCDERSFVLDAGCRMRALGWALGAGGFSSAQRVAWCEFRNQEVGKDVDALQLVRARLERAGVSDALPLLTSAAIARYALTRVTLDGFSVEVCATVGLGNVECVGERRSDLEAAYLAAEASERARKLGTINIACFIYAALSEGAQCEALSIVTEARTRAVLEEKIRIGDTSLLATGTGTDCSVVLVLPAKDGEVVASFAGKHTALGHAVGAASYQALRQAIANSVARKHGDSAETTHAAP